MRLFNLKNKKRLVINLKKRMIFNRIKMFHIKHSGGINVYCAQRTTRKRKKRSMQTA